MGPVEVSVVMAVYNGERYLRQSIDSILNQTYQNWELILINDASTDSTAQILASYHDERIRVLTNPVNLKLPASLNKGIREARGTYILRMDADDICRPDRFQKQVEYLRRHPDTAMYWGLGFLYSDGVIRPSLTSFSLRHDRLKALLLFFCPVYHNDVIMRRELFEKFQYQPEFTISEDWQLWGQISRTEKIQGARDYLVLYRIHGEQVTNAKNREIQRTQIQKIIPGLFRQAGMTVSQEEIDYHVGLILDSGPVEPGAYSAWLQKLETQRRNSNWCSKGVLRYALFWKTDQLLGEQRLALRDYCRICCQISLLGWLRHELRKTATAGVDLLFQWIGKRKFRELL